MFLDKNSSYSELLSTDKNFIGQSFVEISRSAFEHNIRNYKNIAAESLFAAVIKSNAYGHGIEIIAKLCDQNSLVDYLCVVSLSEAVLLRNINIKKPILVLSILNMPLEYAILLDIDLVVYDLETVLSLSNFAKLHNKIAKLHIKVDTGLSRLGILFNEVIDFIELVDKMPNIKIVGLFTHFAYSENADQTYTNYQLDNFNYVVKILEEKNIKIPIKHTTCSAASTSNLNAHFNMIRVGIGIYGLWPSQDNKLLTCKKYNFSLKPVLTWKANIISIKNISAGSYIGYNLTHKVLKDSKIATIPVGYWDGFDRRLSNIGKVLINNQIACVVGIVAMNLAMIDVTDIENVFVNTPVTLLGNHYEINADNIAKLCKTINYEIVARINPLIVRILKD